MITASGASLRRTAQGVCTLACASALSLLVALPCAAQVDRTLTLEETLALTDETPALRADAAQADVERAAHAEASEHPNPELTWEMWGLLGGADTNGGSQQQLSLRQPFMWPGQMDARHAAAAASIEAAQAGVQVSRLVIRTELRRAFIELLEAQAREDVLAAAERDMEALVAVVRGRQEAGAGRRYDLIRLEAELAEIAAERDGVAAERRAAAGQLAAILGHADWQITASGSLSDSLLREEARDADHASVRAARSAREAARARLRSEEAMAVPPITLGLGGMISTAPEGGYLYGTVGMPLPFFDHNQGAIERARRQEGAAELRLEAAELQVTAMRTRAQAIVEARRAALDAFDRGVMSRVGELVSMARAGYDGGELTVFELLDATSTVRDLLLNRLQREGQLREAELELLLARDSGE